MNKYNDHKNLEGKHADCGCSQSTWMNRDDEQLVKMYYSRYASEVGTAIHALAKYCIDNRIKLRKTDDHVIDIWLRVVWPNLEKEGGSFIPIGAYDSKELIDTLSLFVNDAIGYRLDSEVVLSYDDLYTFGTADAISCNEKTKEIIVHDLKTGDHPVKMTQLMLYAAYYCLEYNKNPHEYKFTTRVYQKGQIIEYNPTSDEIKEHMQVAVHATDTLRKYVERV